MCLTLNCAAECDGSICHSLANAVPPAVNARTAPRSLGLFISPPRVPPPIPSSPPPRQSAPRQQTVPPARTMDLRALTREMAIFARIRTALVSKVEVDDAHTKLA